MPGGRYPWAVRAGGPLLGGGSTGFISQWQTDNTGTSNDDQITLPLVSGGTYDFVVDWGDGSVPDTITAFNDPAVTHTFIGGPGTFTVTITGVITGWRFNGGGDAQKLTLVSSWGPLSVGSVSTNAQFFGCTQMDVTATDSLDTTGATSFTNMFRNCFVMSSLNTSGFDTSSVNDMQFMFNGCNWLGSLDLTSFDTSNVIFMNNMFAQCFVATAIDVSSFDTSNVTTMSSMFFNCSGVTTLALDQAGWDISGVSNLASFCSSVTLDTSNYDSILAAWAAQSPVQSAVTCDFGSSVYTIATAQADRDVLTDPPNSWTLTDGGGI